MVGWADPTGRCSGFTATANAHGQLAAVCNQPGHRLVMNCHQSRCARVVLKIALFALIALLPLILTHMSSRSCESLSA